MDLKAQMQRWGALHDNRTPRPTARATQGDPPLETLVPGQWVESGGLRCFTVEERYALTFRHGEAALEEILGVPPEVWGWLAVGADRRPFDLGRAVFVDIETTGLARGSGTYAFLVGVGTLAGDEFVLRQYFMPGYADEEALLSLLADVLRDNGGLVTFNGRAFDWPILETRYIMARREPPCDGEPHLDLLHLSRRLWRRSLASCALSSLERHVLRVERSTSDVPGYLIPQLYQDYLEQGRTRPLADVFYHNLVDVLSMVALAARAGGLVSAPFAPQADDSCDPYSLGALFEAEGHTAEALQAYEKAWVEGGAYAGEAARRLSFLLKRLGRHAEAMEIWQALAIQANALYPFVEIAKHLEHREKDYAGARKVTTQAVAWATSPEAGLGRYEARQIMRELQHRLDRLDRRLQAAGSEEQGG